MPKIVKIR